MCSQPDVTLAFESCRSMLPSSRLRPRPNRISLTAVIRPRVVQNSDSLPRLGGQQQPCGQKTCTCVIRKSRVGCRADVAGSLHRLCQEMRQEPLWWSCVSCDLVWTEHRLLSRCLLEAVGSVKFSHFPAAFAASACSPSPSRPNCFLKRSFTPSSIFCHTLLLSLLLNSLNSYISLQQSLPHSQPAMLTRKSRSAAL